MSATVLKTHSTELSDAFPRYTHDAVQSNRMQQYTVPHSLVYQLQLAGSGRTDLDDYSLQYIITSVSKTHLLCFNLI